MVRLLHTADLHLDSPLATLALRHDSLRERVENATRAALGRIVDIALEEEVSALLIAGDLYDGQQQSVKTAAFLIGAFRRLEAAGIRVFVIRGNHDAESRIPKDLGWPANVHVFDGRGGHVMLTESIAIHGVSFSKPHAPDSLVPRFRRVDGVVNIGLLHTSLGGAAGHDPYAPCTPRDLIDTGFDYWALGHIHRRSVHHQNPFIVMPGMPQGRDMGEHGPKSATLIDIRDGTITIAERQTASVLFLREPCDVSGCTDMADVLDALTTCMRDRKAAAAAVMRLTITGTTDLNWQIRRDIDVLQASLEEAISADGDVWLDRLEIETTAPAETGETDLASDEIAALIGAASTSPDMRREAAAIIDGLVADLPPSLRDVWGDDADTRAANADRLIAAAEGWAIARMHGAGQS